MFHLFCVFQKEAETRLNELTRLLDEHDQIIQEIRRSESTGSGINLAGVASAPQPATPVESANIQVIPSIKLSHTAPTSPATTQPQPSGQPPTSSPSE